MEYQNVAFLGRESGIGKAERMKEEVGIVDLFVCV